VFRITVACSGLTEAEGSGVVSDVLEEFTHRQWQHNVECTWSAGTLSLCASNDFDENGQALLDEFGDAVLASVSPEGTVRFSVVAVSEA